MLYLFLLPIAFGCASDDETDRSSVESSISVGNLAFVPNVPDSDHDGPAITSFTQGSENASNMRFFTVHDAEKGLTLQLTVTYPISQQTVSGTYDLHDLGDRTVSVLLIEGTTAYDGTQGSVIVNDLGNGKFHFFLDDVFVHDNSQNIKLLGGYVRGKFKNM